MFNRKIPVAAVAVAAAGVLGTATTASAATTVYDTKTIVVKNASVGTTCTSRTITLAAGSYGWGWYDIAPTVNTTVKLAAGTYTWSDCLTMGFDYDYLDSKLQLNGSSSSPATMRVSRWLFDGSYTFGSFLKPNF
ncbi:hypothetical protein ACFWIQ_21010 [Kitasatospora sp. NPDC127059]|uniref:hypothetical protein n=1 Tax=unclassified Kitasatospora TaxID=2633591 RepID=UPI00364C4F1B